MLMWWLSVAWAKSWCATPLVAHEWGVTVLTADAAAPQTPALPSYFHRPGDPFALAAAPVRTLPADNGVRTLPVVHFTAPGSRSDTIPVALEVGFRQGEASVWYPAVDRRVPASEANSGEAAAARAAILRARDERAPRPGQQPDLGPDPTRQLHWTSLELAKAPRSRPVATSAAWVGEARSLSPTLWVNQGLESERFVFYEADTVESPAVEVTGDGEHVVVGNRSEFVVHDVVVMHEGRMAFVPALAPGQRATVELGEGSTTELRDTLTRRWTTPSPDTLYDPARDDCVMMRDPMVPVEEAEGHRLYADEVALMWSVWEERLLEAPGTRVVYREDTAALDSVMPVSLDPDMLHFVQWSRLGLVVVDHVELL